MNFDADSVEDPVRVGVLALHDSKETKAILNAVEALGHRTEWLREETVVVEYDEDGVSLTPDVDVVVNRVLLTNTDSPAEELGVALSIDPLRPMLNPPEATARASHKVAAASVLSRAGLPLPRTTFALGSDRLNDLRPTFGEEAVYKTAIGTHGGGTWKVGTEGTLSAAVGKRRAFLQELVRRSDAPIRDLRVYVVGDGDVVASMFRYAQPDDWRTNVALGGDVEDAENRVPDAALDVARRAADAFGLDYAGVDLIEGDDGWYVLEVNPTAGFKGLYRATGRSPAPHIARLAIERAGGEVDDERVEELAATLDDSEPACMPPPQDTESAEPAVIGFTEYVTVSGTTGTETVLAKSDTGAARTSIDLRLAAKIGAGPIHTVARVKSGSSKKGRARPVVGVVLGVLGDQHTLSVNVEDRSHMNHAVLLGRDVLEDYQLDVGRRAEDEDEDTREE